MKRSLLAGHGVSSACVLALIALHGFNDNGPDFDLTLMSHTPDGLRMIIRDIMNSGHHRVHNQRFSTGIDNSLTPIAGMIA
jgi:hypothetical protein